MDTHRQINIQSLTDIDSAYTDNPPLTERASLTTSNTSTTVHPATPQEIFNLSAKYRISQLLLTITEIFIDLLLIYLLLIDLISSDSTLQLMAVSKLILAFIRLFLPVPSDEPHIKHTAFASDMASVFIFLVWVYIPTPEPKLLCVLSLLSLKLTVSFFHNCGCQTANDFEIVVKSFLGVVVMPVFIQHMTIAFKLTDYLQINWAQTFWCYFMFLLMLTAIATLLSLFILVNLNNIFKIIFKQTNAEKYLRNWLILICISVVFFFAFGLSGFSFLFDLAVFLDKKSEAGYRKIWHLTVLFLLFFSGISLIIFQASFMFFNQQPTFNYFQPKHRPAKSD